MFFDSIRLAWICSHCRNRDYTTHKDCAYDERVHQLGARVLEILQAKKKKSLDDVLEAARSLKLIK